MKIHREGFKILTITILCLFIINFIVDRFVPNENVRQLILVASIIIFVLVLQFFRNPIRTLTFNEKAIIAPADGKVVVIEEVVENEFLNEKCRQISIFMSPLNVHINRNPISGTIAYFKYHPGKYLVAWHPKASEENERTTTVINSSHGKILFRQIAGAVARRIVWYVKEGDIVKQNSEMGFIKFGSRVDVFIPLSAAVNVNLDQKVKGGVTIIATF